MEVIWHMLHIFRYSHGYLQDTEEDEYTTRSRKVKYNITVTDV